MSCSSSGAAFAADLKGLSQEERPSGAEMKERLVEGPVGWGSLEGMFSQIHLTYLGLNH